MITREEIQAVINRKREKPQIEQSFMSLAFSQLEGKVRQWVLDIMNELKPKDGYSPELGKDYMTAQDVAEIIRRVTPKKGEHYLSDEEIQSITTEATPKKGEHYFDGKDGRDGKNGKAGKDGVAPSIEEIYQFLLKNKLPVETIDGVATAEDLVRETSKKKKISVRDITDFEQRLAALRGDMMRNYGGHGGITQAAVLTTSDSQTFTLAIPLQLSELQIYRGGGRIFSENGDFTAVGDPVRSITLSSALQAGETLNVLGKA